jgi:hypothetical protein
MALPTLLPFALGHPKPHLRDRRTPGITEAIAVIPFGVTEPRDGHRVATADHLSPLGVGGSLRDVPVKGGPVRF